MADNDDYLDSIDNNHLDGANGSVNMTDNSLGVSSKLNLFCIIKSLHLQMFILYIFYVLNIACHF